MHRSSKMSMLSFQSQSKDISFNFTSKINQRMRVLIGKCVDPTANELEYFHVRSTLMQFHLDLNKCKNSTKTTTKNVTKLFDAL